MFNLIKIKCLWIWIRGSIYKGFDEKEKDCLRVNEGYKKDNYRNEYKFVTAKDKYGIEDPYMDHFDVRYAYW